MRCSSCDSGNPDGKRFCGDCGAPLLELRAATRSADQATATVIFQHGESHDLPQERKTVTALFADLRESTALMEHLDPEDARAIVDPALQIMIGAVRRYEGYVVQSTGDGIFAVFGAPVAHEDHPKQALHAALAMQEELHSYALRLIGKSRIPLAARVGVNTGEVVVRSIQAGAHVEYAPIGLTAHLAARLQTVAPAGSVATSEATRRLCEGYFEFRAMGPTPLKGVSEPVEIYEVIGFGTLRTRFEVAAQRGLTKFVGRDARWPR